MNRRVCLVGLLLLTPLLRADNWPAWRGPHGTGVTKEKDLPVRWSATENIRWKVALPERGNSTPIIWGDRVFVTQTIEKDGQRLIMCFDRKDGKLLWQKGARGAAKEPTHETNPLCSSSPVTDGTRVVAWFGSAGVWCFDLEGKELWRRDLGPQEHIWGYGSSPVLDGGLCYLNFGPGERQFLVALDAATGEIKWKHDEPGGKKGATQKEWIGSWSTPVIAKAGDRTELLLTWPGRLAAYDPASGKELWSCRGLNPLIYTSPLVSDGIAVGMGGFGGAALGVRTGGAGDVTESHRLWHHPKDRQRIGSGAIHDGHIYILDDPGIAECIELKTGKPVWEERLTGPGGSTQSWSSMMLSGDKLYAINQRGDTFIVRASPKFELIATNSLGEGTNGSIAPSNGELFIRTYQTLWCIGKP
jgi:outer membrane protein assembly factor BamB